MFYYKPVKDDTVVEDKLRWYAIILLVVFRNTLSVSAKKVMVGIINV
jgi:hypothetical protein